MEALKLRLHDGAPSGNWRFHVPGLTEDGLKTENVSAELYCEKSIHSSGMTLEPVKPAINFKSRNRYHCKRQVAYLEQQRAEMLMKLRVLESENQQLQHRSSVLQDIMLSMDEVQAIDHQSLPSASQHQEVSQQPTHANCISKWEAHIQLLSRKLLELELEAGDGEKMADLQRCVLEFIDMQVSMHGNMSSSEHPFLIASHLQKSLLLLKVPENQHWAKVATSLDLAPDQRERALTALDIFLSSMRLANPASLLKAGIRRQDAPTKLHPFTSTSNPSTPHHSTLAPDPAHLAGCHHTANVAPPGLPPSQAGGAQHSASGSIRQLRDVHRYERKLTQFHLGIRALFVFVNKRLLTPLQAARANVYAHPLPCNPVALLNAVSQQPLLISRWSECPAGAATGPPALNAQPAASAGVSC